MISDSCHSGSVARMSLMMPNMEKKPAPNRKVRFLSLSYFLYNDSALQAARRVESTCLTRSIRNRLSFLVRRRRRNGRCWRSRK